MKRIGILSLLVCACISMLAQHTYSIRIMNTMQQPLRGVVVKGLNETTGTVLKSTTNDNGTAFFNLTEPGIYKFSYMEVENATTYEVGAGTTGEGREKITYDPRKIFVQPDKSKREGIRFDSLKAADLKGQPGAIQYAIEVKSSNGIVHKNLPVIMVDCQRGKKYLGKTSEYGTEIFYLPSGGNYEVDLVGAEAVHVLKVGNNPDIIHRQVVFYNKTRVDETVKGDTTIQTKVWDTNGSSTHLLFKLRLINFDGVGLPNEVVYADAQNSKAVIVATTDINGNCQMMLPKGTTYLISVKYERGIHLADGCLPKGFASEETTRRYRGSRAVETMLERRQQNLDNEGFARNFESTPVRPKPVAKSYLTKTAEGYNIQFQENGGPIGTPTIIDGNMYTQEQFHSPMFHCLDANTGKNLWAIELGESGMSPVVYHQGILLINTYSCTLYAIDAKTGRMLWSHWLAGTIYSTPSADGNSVFVVYNNAGTNPKNPDDSYVLACFELHTGALKWINWIDREAIACPVVEGNEVHVASYSGNYYVFNKENGKPIISSKTIRAVSSPSISGNKIFITTSNGKKEQLTILDRSTLQVKKKYGTQLTAKKIEKVGGCYEHMNFNGSHPIVYKNEVVVVIDSAFITAFDATTERVLWRQALAAHSNQIPIISDNKVIVGSSTGQVMSYDIRTGAATVIANTKSCIDGQPVYSNGHLYIAAKNLLKAIKSTFQFKWNQWNKDAQHNGVVE